MADIIQRVGVQQHQVGALTLGNLAIVLGAQEIGDRLGAGVQNLERREA